MSSFREQPRATFSTLPSELRNEIYLYVFDSSPEHPPPGLPRSPNALVVSLQLTDRLECRDERCKNRSTNQLQVLATCKQIYHEASLLALSRTTFHLSGSITCPEHFNLRSNALGAAKLSAVRHLTLTARTSHLRALNEAWMGLPFGHPSLNLDTLTIIPKRPEVCNTAYVELADLSQSHTLAYVFSETFKSLRNVRCLELRNEKCFNEVVWSLFYRSLVYRLWRWGGGTCGIKFQSGDKDKNGEENHKWFRAYFRGGESLNEVGQEVGRLMGWDEVPDPSLAGGVP